MNSLIHPTAIVAPGAKIAPDARIGAYSVIGEHVTLGQGTHIHNHVSIDGRTTIGANCRVFPFASLGSAPQDLKYSGEQSELIIGDNTTIREHVTMNPGTAGDKMVTRVGSNCLFMASTHVAHDCVVGDHVILANNAILGGHVEVGDHAIIGGMSAIHQFVRIGKHAIIGGMSGVEHDVIPYGSVIGERASLAGLNITGLKRRGFDREAIHSLRSAYRSLFEDTDGTLAKRVERVRGLHPNQAVVQDIITFLQAPSKRSVSVPAAGFQSNDE